MLRNYLTVAVRNLLRQKTCSVINICGLAIGMACCILAMVIIWHELGYDRFHNNADRVYRVLRERISNNIATGVVDRQLAYISSKKLGFDKEHVVVLPIFLLDRESKTNNDPFLAVRYNVVKQAFLEHPNVLSVADCPLYASFDNIRTGLTFREDKSENGNDTSTMSLCL